ncbi:hypothetical protein C1752_02063 [Acaryochloris thomasi RCC1774]|uniref:GIY-YIG domain-containing protein n=1 Tax=Acaryochloris thomasi RCC1774 TaxID=1764569 RepID=A0A2W1JQH5_9CYAN|nr:GIY-YIG nuclease family protein [Acaryochloris thomasi]PZD73655.1 hypothetical protein C1752_02063 [Acaryochloris thomasi RCC1774]
MNPTEYIDVSKLPSMSLSAKKDFPEIACVYLIIDACHHIHYVGGTANLRKRWMSHHKYSPASLLDQPRLAYLEISPHLVWETEAFLIRTLQPQLNLKTPSESDLVNAALL